MKHQKKKLQEKTIDAIYKETLKHTLEDRLIKTRNANCYRFFGRVAFVLPNSPLLSIRRTAWRQALLEMEWFLSGSSNINDLDESVRHWWRPWANQDGEIKNNYGKQFRSFGGEYDQIKGLIDGLREHPFSRRHVITTWNSAEMNDPETPITNCHGTLIQMLVDDEGYAFMNHYQRSADLIVGLPHNLIQYWAMFLWICRRADLKPMCIGYEIGDAHIYEQHRELAENIISTPCLVKAPNLVYHPTGLDFKAGDFTLDGVYVPIIKDKAEMVV